MREGETKAGHSTPGGTETKVDKHRLFAVPRRTRLLVLTSR